MKRSTQRLMSAELCELCDSEILKIATRGQQLNDLMPPAIVCSSSESLKFGNGHTSPSRLPACADATLNHGRRARKPFSCRKK